MGRKFNHIVPLAIELRASRKELKPHTLSATVSPEALTVEKTSPKVPSPIFTHCFMRSGRMHSSHGRGRCWWHSAYTFSASDRSDSSQSTWSKAGPGLREIYYLHPNTVKIYTCKYISKSLSLRNSVHISIYLIMLTRVGEKPFYFHTLFCQHSL